MGKPNAIALKLVVMPVLLSLWATAPGQQSGQQDDPLLARVNGHEIRLSYVHDKLAALPLGDQIPVRQRLDQFINSVIQEEMLYQFLLDQKTKVPDSVREQVKQDMVTRFIQQQVKDKIKVTRQQVENFYRQNQSAIRDENVRVSHILMARKAQCDRLMEVLGDDEAFAEAARKHSLHESSAGQGGDIGYYMNHAGPLGFETRLFDLQAGDMAVFESEDGCHIVRITEKETPPLPPLENVAPRIEALLAAQQERALLKALMDKSAKQVNVERFALP